MTRYDEFLKDAGSSKPAEAEEPEPEPEPKRTLSQRATITGPRSPSFLDNGTAGYGFFEDPSETEVEEETQEDRKLGVAIETIKAPELAANLGDLLCIAPIKPDIERELAELAHRLSPDELIKRLMPLFSREEPRPA